MNADFALPATPGLARRLLHIAAVSKLDLDPAIHELAKRDLIEDDPTFPISNLRRAALQFMLDCQMRCGVPFMAPGMDHSLLLIGAKLAGTSVLTVVTEDRGLWKRSTKAMPGLQRLQVIGFNEAFEPEYQDGWREGLLIMDIPYDVPFRTMNKLCCVGREFPHTITTGRTGFSNDNRAWFAQAFCLDSGSPIDSSDFDREPIFYDIFTPNFLHLPGYGSMNKPLAE